MERRYIVPELVIREGKAVPGWAVQIDGDRIAWTGPAAAIPAGAPVERWPGLALCPGFVNVHNHSFQSLLRGVADDQPFFDWRANALYKYSPLLGVEGVYVGALLAFGEMLRYGVTTVNDFFYIQDGGNENCEAVIQAARDVGIRLVLSRALYDWEGAPSCYRESVDDAVTRCRALMVRYASDPWVRVYPAPHSPHGASAAMIRAGWSLAAETDTYFHIHVAEGRYEREQIERQHGLPPMRWLERLGVLDHRMVAVHAVWVDESEIALMGDRGAGLAYNPASNMFLGDGITAIPEMLAAGVRVGLGTDGACSNNRTSILDEMRTCALLQKVRRCDPTALTAQQVWRMGTSDAGRLLGLPVGEVAPGMHADLVGIDLNDISLHPLTDLVSNLVYAASPMAVRRVLVGGRLAYDGGDLVRLPLARIRRQVADLMARLGVPTLPTRP